MAEVQQTKEEEEKTCTEEGCDIKYSGRSWYCPPHVVSARKKKRLEKKEMDRIKNSEEPSIKKRRLQSTAQMATNRGRTVGSIQSNSVILSESKEHTRSDTVTYEEDKYQKSSDGTENHHKITKSRTKAETVKYERSVEFKGVVESYITTSVSKVDLLVKLQGPTSETNVVRAFFTKKHLKYIDLEQPLPVLMGEVHSVLTKVYQSLVEMRKTADRSTCPQVNMSSDILWMMGAFAYYDMTDLFVKNEFYTNILNIIYPEVIRFLFGDWQQSKPKALEALGDGIKRIARSHFPPKEKKLFTPAFLAIEEFLNGKRPISMLSIVASNIYTEKLLLGGKYLKNDGSHIFRDEPTDRLAVVLDEFVNFFPIITTQNGMEQNPRKYQIEPKLDGYIFHHENNGHLIRVPILIESGLMASSRIEQYKNRVKELAECDQDYQYFSRESIDIDKIARDEVSRLRELQRSGQMIQGFSTPHSNSFASKHGEFSDYLGDIVLQERLQPSRTILDEMADRGLLSMEALMRPGGCDFLSK
jgi:hypothetical protein